MARIDITALELTNPSTRTISERNKFAHLVDNFATFKWDGIDMFNEFGAFIINDKKGSLKFYNGASFKNEYSKSQFQDGYTNITGISFDTQKISFSIGVYWISIEDYRILLNFLHPYRIAFLSFSFEKEYGYYCKLAERKDSTRYVVGKEITVESENNNNNNLNYSRLEGENGEGYRYYTELQLTFEVIGSQCAKGLRLYNDTMVEDEDWSGSSKSWVASEEVVSDLSMPVQAIITNLLINENNFTIQGKVRAEYTMTGHTTPSVNETLCFEASFKNMKDKIISLRYDSEQSLLYWDLDGVERILSLLSTNNTGMRIVDSLNVKQFYWPGRLDHPDITEGTKTFVITISVPDKTSATELTVNKMSYIRQKRTNIL